MTADGEVTLLTEEVLTEVHLAIGSARQVGQVKRADAEHFTSAFAITCSDDRCVNPEEAVVAEVAMHGLRHGVANASQCAERIGARAQVRLLAQELHAVRLRLNWIGVGVFNKSVHLQFLNLHFHAHGSIFALHLHKHAFGFNTAASGQAHHFVGIISQRVRHHQLQRVKA